MRKESLCNVIEIRIYHIDEEIVVSFPAKARNFPLLQSIQTGSGVHLASYSMGIRAISLGVRQLGHEAVH
jgi:hypothetical protein